MWPVFLITHEKDWHLPQCMHELLKKMQEEICFIRMGDTPPPPPPETILYGCTEISVDNTATKEIKHTCHANFLKQLLSSSGPLGLFGRLPIRYGRQNLH